MEKRIDYAHKTYLTVTPLGLFLTGAALCPDGKVRKIKRIAKVADTMFSVPAAMDVKGKTVSGYVTVETMEGLSTATEDDPAVVKFRPYTYRKNADIFLRPTVGQNEAPVGQTNKPVTVVDEESASHPIGGLVKVVASFDTIAEAENWIADREKIEPEKVHRGGYGIDAPERQRVYLR